MGYVFKGRYNRGAPRDTSYTFTIKAKDENGNYSEPTSITVEHPGIQQLVLEEQDVQGLIASIKINLPKAFSETSQTVYPYDVTSEEKDILGYRLFIQEVDDNNNPVGIEEIINYDIEELEDRIIYYQAETGKRFKVRVGAYDSVYHYDWNPTLFEQTISEPVYKETFKINFIDIDESLISPNGLTETLRNPGVDVSELQDKYTWIVGKNVDGEDIIGGIGLEVNEVEKKVDIQFVADSFRLFPIDENGDIIEGEDKAVFAVDTTPEGSTIFMDANQIGIRASKDDGTGEYNFFVLDGEGLEIFTENFKLDKNGNALFSGEIQSEQFSLISDTVKINNDGITVTGDGFYSRLDDQGLYFYKEGEDEPYWYTKNVASGVAQDGDYIELNWEKTPKVITSINSAISYDDNYNDHTQTHTCYSNSITKKGFYVYVKNEVHDLSESLAKRKYRIWRPSTGTSVLSSFLRVAEESTTSGTWVSNYSSINKCTKLFLKDFYIRGTNPGDSEDCNWAYDISIYYRNKNTNQRNLYRNFSFTGRIEEDNDIYHYRHDIEISNLLPSIYRLEIDYYLMTDDNHDYTYVTIDTIIAEGNRVFDQGGTVSWLAIEGGLG